jgi:hypothetical protein
MLPLVRPPPHPDFARDAANHVDALRAVASAGVTITGKHFKGRTLWSVPKHKAQLVGATQRPAKCAWCERHQEAKRELNVEHFRPKAEVTCWDGAPPLVSDTPPRQRRVSDGYWWLAFAWANYSLACDTCNQTWKRNLFPVAGARVPHGEGMEHREVPLLLHPLEPFRTADHFAWDELGYIDAVSDRGRATIITCGLNRNQLVNRRRATTRNVVRTIHDLYVQIDNEHATRRGLIQLHGLCAPDAEFAGMNRWWVEHTLGWTWDTLDATAR